jgi:hypothetical protein
MVEWFKVGPEFKSHSSKKKKRLKGANIKAELQFVIIGHSCV